MLNKTNRKVLNNLKAACSREKEKNLSHWRTNLHMLHYIKFCSNDRNITAIQQGLRHRKSS